LIINENRPDIHIYVLFSFVDCYESYFEAFERVTEGNGVPLEHLISCVTGVEIVMGENGMKRVKWNEKKDFEAGTAKEKMVPLLFSVLFSHYNLCVLPSRIVSKPTSGYSIGSVRKRNG